MDVAFVEDAQHDVDQQQGAENHQRLAFLGRLERAAGAAEPPLHLARQSDGRYRAFDGQRRLVEADAGGQVEVDVLGGELPIVADPIFLQAALVMGEGRQRHPPAIAGDDVDLLQHLGVLRVARVDLHHHLILVERFVDGRDLPLAESIVEQRGHCAHVDAQALGRVTVDLQADLLRALAVVGVNAGKLRQFG